MAVEIKDAVQIAKDTLHVVFGSEEPYSIRLEEVILDNYNDWVITLSYLRKGISPDETSAMAILGAALSSKRAYKVVKVSKKDGEVKSIKMREDD